MFIELMTVKIKMEKLASYSYSGFEIVRKTINYNNIHSIEDGPSFALKAEDYEKFKQSRPEGFCVIEFTMCTGRRQFGEIVLGSAKDLAAKIDQHIRLYPVLVHKNPRG